MRTSLRTVLVVSRQFVSDIWPCVSDMKRLRDAARRHDGDVVVLVVESSCDVPRCLLDLPAFVDASSHDDRWWQKLTHLISDVHNGIIALRSTFNTPITSTIYNQKKPALTRMQKPTPALFCA